MKKWMSLLLALTLCLCTVCGALAENAGGVDTVSKSKTATNLNEELETTVTLSFPSEEVSLDSDVVFVLDKSTSADVEEAALKMLQNLQKQLEGTSAKIKVGVVIFNKEANTTAFMDLATQYSAIEAAIKQEISSGTNTHAGLLAGKKMLDDDTGVDASRKHLIFVSDGITYMFNETPTAVGWSWWGDTLVSFAGPDNWAVKYGNNNPPASWATWLSTVGTQIAAQGATYDYPYGGTATNLTPYAQHKEYANSIDKALYLTAQVYKQCQDAGYNCYSLVADQNKGTQYTWGPSFMEYLADGKELDFTKIEAKILYMLGAGSTVVDVIGDDFDLIDGSFQLTVGDTQYTAVRDGNIYLFGPDKQFIVEYAPEGESFVFSIYQNVTNFQRVQLSYKLKVANPETDPGTYGQYDRDGSKGYDGLFTNESAVLKPVNSNQEKGAEETFQKPTVSYTVKEPAPTEVPAPTKAPDANVPQTGDNSMPALWAALCAISVAAFVVLSRRRHA